MFKVGQKVRRKIGVPVSDRWREMTLQGVTTLTVRHIDTEWDRFYAEGSDVRWVSSMFVLAEVKPLVAEDWL